MKKVKEAVEETCNKGHIFSTFTPLRNGKLILQNELANICDLESKEKDRQEDFMDSLLMQDKCSNPLIGRLSK